MNEIILMAIAKEPAKRFQTADAFANALTTVPASSAVAPTVPRTPPAGTYRRQHRTTRRVSGRLHRPWKDRALSAQPLRLHHRSRLVPEATATTPMPATATTPMPATATTPRPATATTPMAATPMPPTAPLSAARVAPPAPGLAAAPATPVPMPPPPQGERSSRVVHDAWSTDCARGARGRWNLCPSNQQDQCEGSGRFWNGRAGYDVAGAGPDRTTIYNCEQLRAHSRAHRLPQQRRLTLRRQCRPPKLQRRRLHRPKK